MKITNEYRRLGIRSTRIKYFNVIHAGRLSYHSPTVIYRDFQ